MARKNRSLEETARRAKIRELPLESNISSMEDIQNLFKETIAEFMETSRMRSWTRNLVTTNTTTGTRKRTTAEIVTAARQ